MKNTLFKLFLLVAICSFAQLFVVAAAAQQMASADSYLRPSPKTTLPLRLQTQSEKPLNVAKPTLVASRATGGYCVRLCDGYYFPAPIVRVNENRAGVQDEICGSLCSGSPTLFYRGNEIKESINAQGQTYPQLSTANNFKRRFNKTCSCRANFGYGVGHLRYSHDFTLKRGDIVFFDNEPKVFAGGTSFPFNQDNFTTPRTSAWLETLKLNPEMNEKAKPFETSSSWKLASVVYSMTDARLAENSTKTIRLVTTPRKPKTKLHSLKEILAERQAFGE